MRIGSRSRKLLQYTINSAFENRSDDKSSASYIPPKLNSKIIVLNLKLIDWLTGWLIDILVIHLFISISSACFFQLQKWE